MSPALHEFMLGLVDYAGLFPPAALSVADAVVGFADHKTSSESWMLGRFIAPAGDLSSIAEAAAPHLAGVGSWPVAAIVGDRKSKLAALASLEVQGQNIAAAAGAGLRVEVLEMPLPVDVRSGSEAASFLAGLNSKLPACGLDDFELFLEVKPGGPVAAVVSAIATFAAAKKNHKNGFSRVGVKLRAGGLDAAAFPSCEDIAGVIASCRQEQLAMKFTAGLHHPVRHFNDQLNVMMHGFLNVFGAGLLAHAHHLPVSEIATILSETESGAFRFDETGFAWRHLNVEISKIRTLRSRFFCGFGSCSFTEPRDDLFGLALL